MEKIYIKWNFINDRTEHNFNFYGQEVAFRINVFNSKNKMIFSNIECNTVLLGIDETMFEEDEIDARFYLKEYYIESINEMLNDIDNIDDLVTFLYDADNLKEIGRRGYMSDDMLEDCVCNNVTNGEILELLEGSMNIDESDFGMDDYDDWDDFDENAYYNAAKYELKTSKLLVG